MKTVKEISVKLANEPGTLAEVSELLAAEGIGLVALTLLTDGVTGTVRLVAQDPDRAVNILESTGFSPVIQDIIAAEVSRHPGGLHAVLKTLKAAGVNLEYLYTCVEPSPGRKGTVLILGADNTAAAHDALAKEWIRLLGDELYDY